MRCAFLRSSTVSIKPIFKADLRNLGVRSAWLYAMENPIHCLRDVSAAVMQFNSKETFLFVVLCTG